jgi:rubrerythrin
MKGIAGFLLLTFLSVTCNTLPDKGLVEFKTKPAEQVKTELEAFIESYPWQENGRRNHPLIAASAEEMGRLKTAWKSSGEEHAVLVKMFARADKALAEPLNFPPEGGQHNQWYQCSSCQIGLVTIDSTHHKCPKCGKVYSGFPYDNVLYGRQHSRNFSLAEDAAWAWSVTGNKKYAELAAGILKGYADRYLKYPMVHAAVDDRNIDVAAQKNGKYSSAGHIMEQTLNEAMLMIPLVTAYDLIYDSGVLQSEEKKKIEENLIRAMADCINVHKTGKSNWQTWHNTALMYAGIVLGDKQMVNQSFLDPGNGFMTQMKISVLPEGMWYENSWGYHYYTLSALTIMAEGARRIGADIYSHEMLRKMYLIAFDYLMADGSLPRFGDAVDDSPKNNSINEKAYAVYKDVRLLSTLPAEPTRKCNNLTL